RHGPDDRLRHARLGPVADAAAAARNLGTRPRCGRAPRRARPRARRRPRLLARRPRRAATRTRRAAPDPPAGAGSDSVRLGEHAADGGSARVALDAGALPLALALLADEPSPQSLRPRPLAPAADLDGLPPALPTPARGLHVPDRGGGDVDEPPVACVRARSDTRALR